MILKIVSSKSSLRLLTIKDELYDLGAVYAAMSGSGSSVYGIFKASDRECGR